MWIYSNNSDQVFWLAENYKWAWHLNLFSMRRVKTYWMCVKQCRLIRRSFLGVYWLFRHVCLNTKLILIMKRSLTSKVVAKLSKQSPYQIFVYSKLMHWILYLSLNRLKLTCTADDNQIDLKKQFGHTLQKSFFFFFFFFSPRASDCRFGGGKLNSSSAA